MVVPHSRRIWPSEAFMKLHDMVKLRRTESQSLHGPMVAEVLE